MWCAWMWQMWATREQVEPEDVWLRLVLSAPMTGGQLPPPGGPHTAFQRYSRTTPARTPASASAARGAVSHRGVSVVIAEGSVAVLRKVASRSGGHVEVLSVASTRRSIVVGSLRYREGLAAAEGHLGCSQVRSTLRDWPPRT